MDSYIQYRNYGLGTTTNLVLSYLNGWGDKGTYASNKHISEHLDIDISTLKRSIKTLKDKDIIHISNPKGRNRFIKVKKLPGQNEPHNKVNMSQYVGQNEPQLGQYEPQPGQIEPQLEYNKNNNKNTNKNIILDKNYNTSSGKISQEEYNAFYDYYKKSGYSDDIIKEILK